MKKRNKMMMCRCHKKQIGGMMTPAQMKKLTRPYRGFTTLPVRKPKQYGSGCGCQRGVNFFSDLGGALTGAFHDPLRGLAAGLTLGASEVIAMPADLFKRRTGIKPSTVLDKSAGLITGINPELGMGSKATSFGLKQVGLGKKKKLKRRKPNRRRKK